jgi:hypothetical protein
VSPLSRPSAKIISGTSLTARTKSARVAKDGVDQVALRPSLRRARTAWARRGSPARSSRAAPGRAAAASPTDRTVAGPVARAASQPLHGFQGAAAGWAPR